MKQYVAILLVAHITIGGCSHLRVRTADQTTPLFSEQDLAHAQQLVEMLQRHNAHLKTFKGIGTIKLHADKALQRARGVWAGDDTDKLR